MLRVRVDPRQRFRAERDVKAFRAFDLLPRALDVGVPLQSGENRLLQSEARNDGAIHLDHSQCRPGAEDEEETPGP